MLQTRTAERLRSLAVVLLAGAAWASRALQAQTPAPTSAAQPSAVLTAAADSITAAELARHVSVIAHDSMGGRDTPSPGLTRAAQYVAAQLRALGLQPGATRIWPDTSWLQYYPIPGLQRIDYTTTRLHSGAALTRHEREVVNEEGGRSGARCR